ncbi:hypothetical protein C8I07_03310 [Shewanella baltica]|nr:hypothetical protein C8I07_03310 [Shewanella baltica]
MWFIILFVELNSWRFLSGFFWFKAAARAQRARRTQLVKRCKTERANRFKIEQVSDVRHLS